MIPPAMGIYPTPTIAERLAWTHFPYGHPSGNFLSAGHLHLNSGWIDFGALSTPPVFTSRQPLRTEPAAPASPVNAPSPPPVAPFPTALPRPAPSCCSLPQIAGLVLISCGGLVLMGWAVGIPALTTLGLQGKPMVANSALGFILSGVALVVLKTHHKNLPRTALPCALAIGAVAFLTLVEYASGRNLGIDELLFVDTYTQSGLPPGRMAPNSVLAFLLSAAALGILSCADWLGRRRPWILAGLGLAVLMIGTTSMLGHLTGFSLFYKWLQQKPMSRPTALLFILLGATLLGFSREKNGARWLLGRFTTLGLATGLALLITVATLTLQSNQQLQEVSNRVQHTREITEKILQLELALETGHTHLHDYLTTGHDDRLQRMSGATDRSRTLIKEVYALTADNPAQQANLSRIVPWIDSRATAFQQFITAFQVEGIGVATALIQTSEAPAVSDQINTHLAKMVAAESERLAEYQATEQQLNERAAALLPTSLLLGAMVLITGVLRLNTEASTRLRELTLQHESAEKLAAQAQARAQALATLAKSEARFKTIFEESPLGIALIDSLTGRICEVNPRFAAIAGRSREVLATIDWMQITHPDDVPPELEKLAAMNAGKTNGFQLEKRYLQPGGETMWINLTVAPLRVEDPTHPRHLCMIEDITERKRLEQLRKDAELELNEKRERLTLATRHNGIGIWDYNPISHKLVWDDSLFELYHIRREDFIGTEQAWRASLHPDDLPQGDQALSDAITGKKPLDIVFRIILPDGSIRYIKGVAKLFRDEQGNPVRLLGANWDITALKEAEEHKRVLNAQLEQRVAERTAELNTANTNILKLNAELLARAAKLETVNKELESFSYTVAHDLRAPLRAIDGYARMAIEDLANMIDANGRRLLLVISAEAKRMGRLIDDLLAFSRISRQQTEPVSINMRALAQDVYNELIKSEPQRTVQFNLNALPAARGTQEMIRLVWVNLLSNALKFTRKRPVAIIEIGAQADTNGEWIYHIKDNGAGFDMRHVDKLFGVFQRLHDQSDFEGTGVGLALVQRILQRHGGRIWAEGAVDQGSVFYFTLPAPAPGTAEGSAPISQGG